MATHIIFILDRSGSMSGLEKDVIGGFNSFIAEQKKLKDKAYLTTVLFNTSNEILHENLPIHRVPPITAKEYRVGGGTALLDAVGKAMSVIDKNADINDKIMFVINTDGEENSSTKFTKEQIKDSIIHYTKWHDWKFIFMGANIDAFTEGYKMGINYNFNYSNTSRGVATAYAGISNTVSTFRNSAGNTVDTSTLENLTTNTTDTP